MHRNKSVDVHQFAMIPKADIPRSGFRMQKALKTTFNAGDLVPFYVEEVLPGDTFNVRATLFARLATPLFPIMDNLHLETFFFFVPNRLVWQNWERFMGEQDNPASPIDFEIPTCTSADGGYLIGSTFDYMGLPTVGQVLADEAVTHSALPLRGYNLIYNEWFRDENLQDSRAVPINDGPDATPEIQFSLRQRGKRKDYFTGCLPWPQKGPAVSLSFSGDAPVRTSATELVTGPRNVMNIRQASGGATVPLNTLQVGPGGLTIEATSTARGTATGGGIYPTNLYADLSEVTATTINQIRQSFQIQKLLERDARGGTRYTEIVRSHFGVTSPDARLQRPEYLGGGHTPIAINPVAQTSASAVEGSDTPQGNLAAIGTALAQSHGFSQSFVEHGYVIGLLNVRADLTYQQGLRRHWSRSTRYDFYFPAFAMLGEQAVLSKEIYYLGDPAFDELVFGYQERWAEYRYNPSEITGLFRSTAQVGGLPATIDPWHLAQRFTTRPSLNAAFIVDPTKATLERAIAVGSAADVQQFICDVFFDEKRVRPLPMYSVPGLVDHF